MKNWLTEFFLCPLFDRVSSSFLLLLNVKNGSLTHYVIFMTLSPSPKLSSSATRSGRFVFQEHILG